MSSIPDNNRRDRHDGGSLRIEIIVDPEVADVIDQPQLRQAAAAAAAYRRYDRGEIGIRVCGDSAIQKINAEHLGHDYPTDVISFSYGQVSGGEGESWLEGELVASWDTARRRAAALGWSANHELVLYVVHGTLHITGMDDQQKADRAQMRRAEQEIMIGLGIDEIVRFGADAESSPAVRAAKSGSVIAEDGA